MSATAVALRMDPMLHIAHQDDASLIGHYGNVLLGISSGKSAYSHLDLSYELHRKLRREYPGGFAKLVISAGGSRMPSAEERVGIHRLASDFASSTLAIALVFEGDGLWLSSMRVVTRTMMLAIAKPFPQSIFANVPESVHWLASRCGSEAHFNPSMLISALRSVR